MSNSEHVPIIKSQVHKDTEAKTNTNVNTNAHVGGAYIFTGTVTYDNGDVDDHEFWASAICAFVQYLVEFRDIDGPYSDKFEAKMKEEFVRMILISGQTPVDILTQLVLACIYIRGDISAVFAIDGNLAVAMRNLLPPDYRELLDTTDLDLYMYGLLIPLIITHKAVMSVIDFPLHDNDILNVPTGKIIIDDAKGSQFTGIELGYDADAKSVGTLNPTILL